MLATDLGAGLTDSEVERRRATFGTNDIAEKPPATWRKLARDTAADPMIWFLVLTSGLFGAIGQITDMVVLLVAVIPLVGMDFYLHRRTQASLAGLSSVLSATAKVLRNGSEKTVTAAELVPGDVVLVASGEPFPADGLIAAGADLQAEESSLTGEAYPVAKHALAPDEQLETRLSVDSDHWGFAGTRLLVGRATLRIVSTGKDTVYGEIVKSAIQGPDGPTPLQTSVAALVKVLLIVAGLMCLLLAGVRLTQGYGLFDAFLSAATLAVAAIPEEFPIVVTFFLGVGVYRLAKRQALVRRALAVENIGRVSTICCDKTGTITEGVLTLGEVFAAAPRDRAAVLQSAALASRRDSGDPLDTAVLDAAGAPDQNFRCLKTYPFTEGRRRETAIWHDDKAGEMVAAKGAAETILDLCSLPPDERAAWEQQIRDLAAGGKKVIACASIERPASAPATTEEPASGFVFAGLLAFSDPLRAGVGLAVAAARRAGIRVVMVTGDHPETAMAIAKEAGIATDASAMSGDEVEASIKAGDRALLHRLSVVARATPGQKLMLVRALQEQGEIVAVTGDGVNDVPALRAADVGIAMGMRGTQSAREVSPIILLDDNFRTIVGAISEGRQLFANLKASFTFLLMVHIPLVASAALIPLLGFPLLYLPVHIVWLELIIHPAALLAFQQTTTAELGARPRVTKFFAWREWLVIVATGIAITAALFLLFVQAIEGSQGAAHARTVALVALVVTQASLVALLTKGRGRVAWAITIAAVASALLFPQVPVIAAILHLHPLTTLEWLQAAMIGCVVPVGTILASRLVLRTLGYGGGATLVADAQ